MADCMAGAWAQDLDSRGALETGDIDATVDFTVNTLGDPGFIAEYDPQAHGNGAQRSQSILLGYSDGFLGCNIVISMPGLSLPWYPITAGTSEPLHRGSRSGDSWPFRLRR